MFRTVHWEVFIGLLFLVLGLAAYFDDRDTHRDVTNEVRTNPSSDHRALVYRWSGYVVRNCRGHRRREIRQAGEVYHLNDHSFPWIPENEWRPNELVEFTVAVPLRDIWHALKEGPATYHVTEIAVCNQIQDFFGGRVESEYPSVEFNIKKATSAH